MSALPAAAAVFDVCGPLPTGTTLLEASAGTGKTFTIAALATRYVAEGVAELSELMLVTFGRAATSELRDRVRERLVSAERTLRQPGARHHPDPLVRHLAAVDDAELLTRQARLTRAVAEFDAATIATTHGFCLQMLSALGVAGDLDTDAVFVPDVSDLVDEVVDDLYLQRYSSSADPPLSEQEARLAARAAASDVQAALQPAAAAPDSRAGRLFAFARDVVAEVRRRKRARHVIDYDDLVVLLRDALADPFAGEAAATLVRERYSVVLVDEFQDTDPLQWDILRAAFHGWRTLVLIGDPKQAIYAFRGGDVVTYLSAAAHAGTRATLGVCWRSDGPLLAALQSVFRGAALGDDEIVVRPVEARHGERRLRGGPPLRLRHVLRPALGVKGSANAKVDAVRKFLAADVAADIVGQLRNTTLLAPPAGASGDARWRPLQPADVAVLTRRNADAVLVRDALVGAGVPAVFSGLSSVFATPSARHWLTLLSAMQQPGSAGRVAALALTPFVGWDARRLALADDAERDDLADRVRGWSQLFGARGVAALLEASAADGLAERLLGVTAGERTLTDLRHVGEALHVAAVRSRLGPAALSDWLRTRIAQSEGDYAEERSRRLETDAAAVQVVTVHASKGLEFPVVYVPFAWDRFEGNPPAVLSYHDGPRRTLHVGGSQDPCYETVRKRHLEEERAEDLRLLYVALTRARSQVVAWWAPSANSPCGPLTRLLLGEFAAGQQPPVPVTVGNDAKISAVLDDLASRSAGTIRIEPVGTGGQQDEGSPPRWTPAPTAAPTLDVARVRRRLDSAWRRTSYTGLTAAAHAVTGIGEPERTGVQDEGPDSHWAPAAPSGDAAAVQHPAAHPAQLVASPMAHLPSGTSFGTLVHAVLERVDPTAADLGAELLRHCADTGLARVAGADPTALAAALVPVLTTPLGPLADGVALRDVAPADRLAELEFELPLAGGDAPAGPGATLADLAGALRRHLPTDDAFTPYADHLNAPELDGEQLRGYLTGSLDAVLRLPGRSPRDGVRYLVVDYKTNRLGPSGPGAELEPLTAWHYRPAAMAEAMMQAHYPLQLMLYLVALHRFLRWRQPGYDPAEHLGGGLYLFLRGMCGPDTPVIDGAVCGVLGWRPPAALVEELSALLDGQR